MLSWSSFCPRLRCRKISNQIYMCFSEIHYDTTDVVVFAHLGSPAKEDDISSTPLLLLRLSSRRISGSERARVKHAMCLFKKLTLQGSCVLITGSLSTTQKWQTWKSMSPFFSFPENYTKTKTMYTPLETRNVSFANTCPLPKVGGLQDYEALPHACSGLPSSRKQTKRML